MPKIETNRQGGVGLPNGMLVVASNGLDIEKVDWDKVKDHPVIKAMIDDGTLVVDSKGRKSAAGDRDENGDTPEMAEMRTRFDAAYQQQSGLLTNAQAEATKLTDRVAELELENEDLKEKLAKLLPAAPEAKHRGAGSYSIMEGDKELREKLTKEQAETFNALDDEGKANWLAENSAA